MSSPVAPLILASTGAIARYPLARKFKYATRTNQFADFSRQTFSQLAAPLGSWVVNLSLLQDHEVQDWRDFHEAMLGAATPFMFIDPSDNLLQYTELLETSSAWTASKCFVAANTQMSDIFGIISGRPRTITVNNTTGSIIQSIAIPPSGYGNSRTAGLTVTASIFANSDGGYYGSGYGTGAMGRMVFGEGAGPTGPAFVLSVDDGASEIASTICDPNAFSGWQRFSVTHTFAVTNPNQQIRFVLNGFSLVGPLQVMGAQLELEGVMTPYKRRSAYCGVHPRCYFVGDELDDSHALFNQHTLTLTIEESN